MTIGPDQGALISGDGGAFGGQTVLNLVDLTIRFPHQDAPVVAGVSLELKAGECLAVVGESGSGKTLTARALLGMTPPAALTSVGQLQIGDVDATNLTERQWRELRGRSLGLVSQDALVALDPLRRVGAEVAEALEIHGLRRTERRSAAEPEITQHVTSTHQHRERGRSSRTDIRLAVLELLDLVALPEAEERSRQYPHQLSGGLRQRALIAAALSAGPGILIADEPTTALDVTVQVRILDLLRELKNSGIAILLISHDLAVVGRIADRVMVMRNGRVVETGTAASVLSTPRAEYTRSLLAAVPTLTPRDGEHPADSIADSMADSSVAAPGSGAGPRSGETPLLRVSEVSRYYRRTGRSDRVALHQVSFDLDSGVSLGIVGESGSGKTTLARAILAFERPSSGFVELGGQTWSAGTERSRRSRRGEIQFIAQDPLSSFDPRYSVRGIIAEAVIVDSGDRDNTIGRARERRVRELLDQVGLSEGLLERRATELSGGQRQRVAIARALAPRPRLLVCDEPVSALDVSVQAQILSLLEAVREQTNLAIVCVSHDLAVVAQLCERVLVMKDGRVVESGSTTEVFSRPQQPFTRELVAAVPRLPRSGSTPSAPPTAEFGRMH